MSSKTAALAGGGALVAAVVVVSFLVLGEDPPAAKVGASSTSTATAPPRATEPSGGGTMIGDPGDGPGPSFTPPSPSGGGARPTPTPTPTARPAADPRRPTTPVEATPPGAVEVTFRCVDDRDQRLQGVWIEVQRGSGAPLSTLTSDAQGEARLGGVVPGDAIQGAARHPLSNETVAFGPITIKAGSVVSLRFRKGETGTLRGRVLDQHGLPVMDARLRLIDPKQAGEAVLDGVGMGLGPDGTFVATVAAGTYSIWAEAPGFAASDRAYATVPPGGEAGPLDLVLFKQGRIAGRVSLPPDLAGALPVAVDLVVEVTRGTEENPFQQVKRYPLQLDASFGFAIEGCDPGRYRLRVEAPAAGGNRVGKWYAFSLDPGKNIEGVTLVLDEAATAVRGVVRDDRGVPIEGARVSVRGREATTDREGRYALHGLDEGEDIFIEARADGHAPATRHAVYEGVELTVDLVLQRTGGVRGRVVGAGAGVPVILCQRSDLGVRPHQVACDQDGGYLLEGLPPGSYYIKAGPGANPFDASGAPTVEVLPGVVVDAPDVRLP